MVCLESITPVLPIGETILQISLSSALPAAAPGLILLGLSFHPCSAGFDGHSSRCLLGWLVAQAELCAAWQLHPCPVRTKLCLVRLEVPQKGSDTGCAPGCITIRLPECLREGSHSFLCIISTRRYNKLARDCSP